MRLKKAKFSHNFLTFMAMLLGIITGFLNIGVLDEAAVIVSEVTIRLMKLVSIPLMFLSIVSSAAHFKDLEHFKLLGRKILKYTVLTTLLAALLAEVLYLVLAPALLGSPAPEGSSTYQSGSGFFKTLLNMIPDNLGQAFVGNNVLAIVLMGIALAVALLFVKQKEREIVFGFFGGLLDALMRIVQMGLRFIPISVWAFVTILANQIALEGFRSVSVAGGFALTVIIANLLQGTVVIPLLLKYKKINPLTLFGQVKEALILGFFTRSSTASLPVTMEHTIKDAHVREDVARLTLPLCTTINMNGCAQFILLAVYFVSAHAGHTLMWWDHVGMILLSVIAAIGNAGVPMGCFFLASSIIASRDMPLHLMGSILPLYAFIDMVETALNIWADVSVTKIVDSETGGAKA